MGQVTTMEITYAARDSSLTEMPFRQGTTCCWWTTSSSERKSPWKTALEKLAQESQERGGEFLSAFSTGEASSRERRNRPWPI